MALATEQEQPAPAESRREALVAAFDKAAAEPAKPAEAKPETTEAKPAEETAAQKAERARDEGGRFAKTDKKQDENKAEAKVEAVAVSEAKAARKYPSTWKRDYEPVYRKLEANPEYQSILDEIERRESDHLKQIGQYKPNVEFANTVRNVLKPYEQTLQQLKIPPEQAISALLAADQALRTAPPDVKPALAMRLLQGYGIDPQTLSNAQQVNPEVWALQSQLQQTQQQVQTFLTSMQKSMEQEAVSEVESFKEGHPFFDDVRAEMGKLIEAGLASTIQDAYDKAIYANPVIRARVLAEQQAKAEAERRQKEQQKVEHAKSAGVQVKGAPTGSTSTARKPKDRRAELEEQFRRYS